ncbi:hypothetical protein [Cupriavidus pinatubonensis]|uniref:hypothetical protein n=1 Tax=Cupriavidus pinatubonensis TaxID=248026 RepID=UPI00361A7FAA
MSVPDQTTIFQYTGNGVTTTFAYGFYLLSEEDIVVSVDDVELTTGFTVNGIGSQSGGAVIFDTAPADGVSIVILRQVAIQRDTDYQRNGDLRAQTLNLDFDRLWMAMQDARRDKNSALHYPVIENLNGELPSAGARANQLLGFGATGVASMFPITASVGAGDLRYDVFVDGVDFVAGTSTSLTLSRAPGSSSNVEVYFDAAFQGPDQWSVAASTLTFTSPIPLGVTRVYARTGTTLSVGVPQDDSVGDQQLSWGTILHRVCDSVAALQDLDTSRYKRAFLVGYRVPGDGGGGDYYYDEFDTTTPANGGTVLASNVGSGRWKLRSLHFVTIHTFGGYGDAESGSPHDDTAAIQAAIDWAAASGSTLRVTAMHAMSAAVTIDSTDGGNIAQGGRRISIIGNGKSNSGFVFTGNTNISLFTFNGNAVDVVLLEGFRIQRKDAASEFGIGLTFNHTVTPTLRGLKMFRLDTGIVFSDCNSVLIDDCDIGYCGLAVEGHFTSISVPNAITFSNCSFNSNIRGGVSLIGGVTNVFLNCRIEGNGVTDAGGTTPGANAVYIRTNNPVNTNFMSAFTMVSCYFEGNAGNSDLYADFRGATTVNISGTLFNRTNVSNYVTNDIVFDASSLSGDASPIALEMSGNSFTSQGTYVPNSGRRAINYLHGAAYTGFKIQDANIYQNSVEVPLVDATKDTLRGDPVKVLAMGSADGSGTLSSNYGIVSCVKNSTGNYTINLKNGATTIMGSFSHVSSGANAGLTHQIKSRTTSSITVQWMNPALGAQDPIAFDFVLFQGF